MNSINDILSQKATDLFPNEDISTATNKSEAEEPKIVPDLDVSKLRTMVYDLKDRLDNILRLLDGQQLENLKKQHPDLEIGNGGERIVEGVFNGEKMVGADGKEYSMPANYASKSKLVEGDLLKLTITNNGVFLFKQIGPIARKTSVGELINIGDQFTVLANNKTYKVLTASVTFYKGKAGDEVVIIIPKDSDSTWAAVDNVIKNT